jgi:hypothetical protein
MKMVSVAQKLSMIKQHKEQNCLFGKEIIGTKITNQNTVLGLGLGEDVGFWVNNNFCPRYSTLQFVM